MAIDVNKGFRSIPWGDQDLTSLEPYKFRYRMIADEIEIKMEKCSKRLCGQLIVKPINPELG